MKLDIKGRGIYCGHEFVNLRLEGAAKNLLFATCNIGAESESEFGECYQFGQVEPYDETWRDFDSQKPIQDVCKVKMGGDWRLPTIEEFCALVEQTEHTWTQIGSSSGMKCYKVIDGKERYVFLPACGSRYNDGLYNVGLYGNYWSSSLYSSNVSRAYILGFNSLNDYWRNLDFRFYGYCVRPVFGFLN